MANMIFYLMNGYNINIATGTSILQLWSAISNALDIVGAFLADSFLGRFWVIALGSFSSLLVSISFVFFFFLALLLRACLVS
ncbi:protein nrt1/ ptr family 1.2 [Quercus suber]|uniref:Protein nrt1/ ptr family 1.2 n=1 Tax=Quercus suber TaxID=58331 RepID=A0AAW0K118_QUESU